MNNNFIDSSSNGYTVSNNGVLFSKSIYKFGGYSAKFGVDTIDEGSHGDIIVTDCGQVGQILSSCTDGSDVLDVPEPEYGLIDD